MTDLHKAAEHGDEAKARALIAQDPYLVGAAADFRRTPLHLAARAGRTALVELLLDHSADANARDYGGGTPLHAAAGEGRLEVARALLQAGARPNLLDADGHTPLHKAVRAGHGELVELLLGAGAEPNARRDDGATPLHEAAAAGRIGAARRLLAHGALANAQSNASETRWSPWHEAVRAGHADLAELLRLHGGADAGRGPISIHDAAARGYAGRVELLLEREPQLIASRDFLHRRTPLHFAAAAGHEAIVARLLAAGADVRAADKQGRTPLDLAAAQGFDAVAQLLR
jgi:cytohesin